MTSQAVAASSRSRSRCVGSYLVAMTQIRAPSLADEVVLLRSWRQTDVPAQLEAFSDPWFRRFSDWAPRTEAEARAYLDEHEQAL